MSQDLHYGVTWKRIKGKVYHNTGFNMVRCPKKDCRHSHRESQEKGWQYWDRAACPYCKRVPKYQAQVEIIWGREVVDETCGPKCFNAHGPSCECSCGGLNHGSGHPRTSDKFLTFGKA